MTHFICLVIALAGLLAACDKERQPPPVHEPPPADVVPWTPPTDVEALVTPAVPAKSMDLGGTHRYPDCWEFLERDGKPLDPFPFEDLFERAERLTSCGAEAHAVLEDGAHVVAWGTDEQPGSRARDLRLAVWEKDGTLRWFADLDRSRQAANWQANFRRSFIAPLPPKHLCFGSLWEGDTQVMCAGLSDGKAAWTGSLPFWAGMAPQAGDKGLVVADISALTQRYPFDGSEMRHRKLDGLGGRAGYYATDGERLYFAPSRIDAPPLIAYDLRTFEEIWRTPLPSVPAPTFAHVLGSFDRLLLAIDDRMFAIDTETGKAVWAYDIGDDIPWVAVDKSTLYVLSRRAESPNRLVAIEPRTGKRLWAADTPTGTLHVYVVDDVLMIGSVRAVQRVKGVGDEDRDGK